jgi:hypothetical protein
MGSATEAVLKVTPRRRRNGRRTAAGTHETHVHGLDPMGMFRAVIESFGRCLNVCSRQQGAIDEYEAARANAQPAALKSSPVTPKRSLSSMESLGSPSRTVKRLTDDFAVTKTPGQRECAEISDAKPRTCPHRFFVLSPHP